MLKNYNINKNNVSTNIDHIPVIVETVHAFAPATTESGHAGHQAQLNPVPHSLAVLAAVQMGHLDRDLAVHRMGLVVRDASEFCLSFESQKKLNNL